MTSNKLHNELILLKEKRPNLHRVQVFVTTEFRFDYTTMAMETVRRVEKIEMVEDKDNGYWTSCPIPVEKDESLFDVALEEAKSDDG